MKRFIPLLVTGVGITFATPVLGDDASGAVKQINAGSRQVTLEDGKTYVIIGGIDISKFKVGDKVKLSYTPASQLWMSLGVHGNASEIAALP
jgi:hypothetical protein